MGAIVTFLKYDPLSFTDMGSLTILHCPEIDGRVAGRGLGEAEEGQSDQVWMDRRGLCKYFKTTFLKVLKLFHHSLDEMPPEHLGRYALPPPHLGHGSMWHW